MSIHGICFDEGQAGNCGLECQGFLEGECPIPLEIAEIFKDDLLKEYIPLEYAIQQHVDKPIYDELAKLDEILESVYGY